MATKTISITEDAYENPIQKNMPLEVLVKPLTTPIIK